MTAILQKLAVATRLEKVSFHSNPKERQSERIFKLLINCTHQMAPDSSTLAWQIPWTEEPGRLQSMGSLRVDTTEQLPFHFSLSCIGEGNGNPLQCSCLENPRDGGAWWAAVYGVVKSRTQVKWLSSSLFRGQDEGETWPVKKQDVSTMAM